MARRFAPIRSQLDGFRRANKVWVCKDPNCEVPHIVPPREHKYCDKCGQRYPYQIKQCLCGSKRWKPQKPPSCVGCQKDDFHYFASETEFKHWAQYRQMEKTGLIKNLKTQVKVPLKVNGQLVGTYRADFMFHDQNNKLHVIDTKGAKEGETKLYNLKRALVKAIYNIDVVSKYGGS